LTRIDSQTASVRHWDDFWRAREKAVTQTDPGSQDPAPAAFWETFFNHEFASRPQTRLLDVACGIGAVTAIAMRVADSATASVTAHCVDYSASALEELQKSIADVDCVACDASQIPYPDGSFDLVVSQFGIEYAGDAAFDEAARLVDSKGTLAALVHQDGGAIQQECADNLATIESVNNSRLIPLARDAFAAGFDTIAGKITNLEFQEYDKRLAGAVAAAKNILTTKGTLALGGLLANVYRDIAYMYPRLQNYRPDEVFAWFDGVSDELVSYEGRMASMTRSALDESDIHAVADRVTRLGFTVQPIAALSLDKTGQAGAWILVAKRAS